MSQLENAPQRLVIATHNPGKAREFKRILEPLGVEVFSCEELGIHEDVEETGLTFAENARIKSLAVLALTGLPSIADDSGLCVDALGGAPGVYSARYAQGGDDTRIEKLLGALSDTPDDQRGACFVSAICCSFPGGGEITAEGVCSGRIGRRKQGEDGFGYDPVFLTEHGSFAELSPEQKDAVSHRGKALREFYEKFRQYRDKNN